MSTSEKRVALNGARLVRTRVTGRIVPTAANRVVAPDGRLRTLPGQGGVVVGIGTGDPAGGWVGDHVEPGISLGHPEDAANRALQVLSCVGNRVTMVDGPAAGAVGVVVGKHGQVLVHLAAADLARVAPGEWAVIEAEGVGLRIEGEPDIVMNSCSAPLLERLVAGYDAAGRLVVPVVVALPAEAAAAGIGMEATRFNIDLQVDQPPIAELAAGLRFGDVVALLDHDHRYGRRYHPGWVAIGVICHGASVGGGHGLGMMTLLGAPASRLALPSSAEARLGRLLAIAENLHAR
jgi:hypothetical protein